MFVLNFKIKVMQKSPLSIRVIYILTSLFYYLTIVISSFGVIFALGLLIGFWGDNVQLTTEIPLKANFEEVGQINFLGTDVKVEVVDAVGKFHFIDTPPIVARTLAIPMLVLFPILFWLVFLFHRFIRNVSEGRIFDKSNFELLQRLGFGLVILWLFTVIGLNVMRYIVLGDIKFNSIIFYLDRGNWYAGILVGALFTLVLSHVFLKGLELQEENELTI